MFDLFLFSLPWLAVGLFLAFVFRNPPELPAGAPEAPRGLPFVSVIVPARNEEANIEACVTSLAAMAYPGFEVLVVDDRSTDRTAEIAARLAFENPSSVRLVRGDPLPDGWFGKPWACWQGARESRGQLLLFTDADTTHSPSLLHDAVQGMEKNGADLITLVGRQVMGSFWERILQPQFFMLIAVRYPRTGSPKRPHQWRNSIANGQYLLFSLDAYHEIGGHRAVAGEVVEDLRLAQLLVKNGGVLVVKRAEGLETRMYRSLSGLIEGWSKNVATAALQTTIPWLRPIILPLSMALGVILWLLPPMALAWTLATGSHGVVFSWALVTTGLNVMVWSRTSMLMKGNPLYGLLYPLGAVLSGWIIWRSWRGGVRIQWKGRSYEMSQRLRTPPSANLADPGSAAPETETGPCPDPTTGGSLGDGWRD